MKKIINYSICILMFAAGTTGVYGQVAQPKSKPDEQGTPRPLTDQAMNDRLQKDWSDRNSMVGNQEVNWKDSGYGYYGTYSNDDLNYMARYDKQGNYVETLTKKEWNDSVPSFVRSSFDKSDYKSRKVTGYWEVTDPSRKGYYLEMNDDHGASSGVWLDGQGKFSNRPSSTGATETRNSKKDKNMYLVPDSTARKNQ